MTISGAAAGVVSTVVAAFALHSGGLRVTAIWCLSEPFFDVAEPAGIRAGSSSPKCCFSLARVDIVGNGEGAAPKSRPRSSPDAVTILLPELVHAGREMVADSAQRLVARSSYRPLVSNRNMLICLSRVPHRSSIMSSGLVSITTDVLQELHCGTETERVEAQ
jgi:hypothetical protein